MSLFTVLVVDEQDSLRAVLREGLEGQGHPVLEARDQPEAIQHLERSRPVVVLTELHLPSGDGFDVLRAGKELDPDLQVLVMTANGTVEDAVRAMKEGAADFLLKPVDLERVLPFVARAIAQRRSMSEYIQLKEDLAERRGAPRIIGEDAQLRQVSQQLHRAAVSDATVLLQGESGTGKELFARALHALSDRADGPFVAINCAAIPETLLETELFGHEKGAFTGAVARKPGRFEMAHRGTLFLDEIGDLGLALQAKILRALEEKCFERVGGTASLHVDTRVVAATNRNLKAGVAAHQFREDLYFRLSVFPITIPPLRQRPRDVPILARYFVERFCRDLRKETLRLSSGALETLSDYQWPGNVRELQNCMERAVILCEGDTIHAHHLNLSAARPVKGDRADGDGNHGLEPPPDPWTQIDLSGTLGEAIRRVTAEVERRKVAHALKEAEGNRVRAADALQVSYKALLQKQKEYGIGEN